MIIDFHTHCFPDKIAGNAVNKLHQLSGGLKYYTDGTKNGLLNSMKECNVNKAVVLNIATNAHQQRSVNDFAISINGDSLISFGSVFPDSKDAFDELDRLKSAGIKGIKLHPDYQGFEIDNEKYKPLYKKISKLNFITVFHAGFDYGYPPPYKASPKKSAKALTWFDSPVVLAHMGGLNMNEDVLSYLAGSDVYFDTAFCYSSMPRYYAEKIIQKHGADKILFGTDSPWRTADIEMQFIDNIGLSENEKELILYKNAKKLLNV